MYLLHKSQLLLWSVCFKSKNYIHVNTWLRKKTFLGIKVLRKNCTKKKKKKVLRNEITSIIPKCEGGNVHFHEFLLGISNWAKHFKIYLEIKFLSLYSRVTYSW